MDMEPCDSFGCPEPAASLVVTRRRRGRKGITVMTEVCWDITNPPKTGWAQASKYCPQHLTELLTQLGEVLR